MHYLILAKTDYGKLFVNDNIEILKRVGFVSFPFNNKNGENYKRIKLNSERIKFSY